MEKLRKRSALSPGRTYRVRFPTTSVYAACIPQWAAAASRAVTSGRVRNGGAATSCTRTD